MSPKEWAILCVFLYLIFIIIGFSWLFPRKLKILKKLGRSATNDELVKMAKNGNGEISKLIKDTKLFIVFALIFALILFLLKP